jgi:hypothetical protein
MFLNIHTKAKMFETQYEKNLVINGREFKYKGIFRVDDLFLVINRALEERGYEKREKKSEEIVTEAGRKSYVELRPYKNKSSYLVFMIKIKINLNKITEIMSELKSEKKKFQQGDVGIVFDSWIMTDYANRWGMKPWVYFLKGLFNKFVYTFPLEAGAPGELVGDTAYIYGKIKKLFASYRPEIKPGATESEVQRAVGEDVERHIREIAASDSQ